jgi:hypothetical protein
MKGKHKQNISPVEAREQIIANLAWDLFKSEVKYCGLKDPEDFSFGKYFDTAERFLNYCEKRQQRKEQRQ